MAELFIKAKSALIDNQNLYSFGGTQKNWNKKLRLNLEEFTGK